MEKHPTAAIIVIGDEILKGHTKDTNSHFLCQELYKLGVRVSRISVIPDIVDVIAEEVLLCSDKFSYVLTSGGIGPTHDDITYEGIAKAFQENLVINKELNDILKLWCNVVGLDKHSVNKMSVVPVSARVHHVTSKNSKKCLFAPIVSVRNVYIFPGIPSYLEYSFHSLKHLFCFSAANFFQLFLYLNVSEFEITEVLNRAVCQFKDQVKFGSYPDLNSTQYQVMLSLEADSQEMLDNAEAYLRNFLPNNSVVSPSEPGSKKAIEEAYKLCNESLDDSGITKAVKESILLLEQCISQHSVESICLSFNGGKDCTALLHLTSCVFHKNSALNFQQLKAVYIRSPDPFPEVEDFIHHSVRRYKLNLITYEAPIKDALRKLLCDHPEVKTILMGTRHTDPYSSKLQPFHPTDSDWPSFMRVSPLLHWGYHDVWVFLRKLCVPYCSLYDRGYTSLGCQNNTVPNPKLQQKMANGELFYKPAFLLKEPDEERSGRTLTKL